MIDGHEFAFAAQLRPPPGATVDVRPGDMLVTEGGAAAVLDVSASTLQRYRRHGGGPAFVRVGRKRVGYRLSDLQAWRSGVRAIKT